MIIIYIILKKSSFGSLLVDDFLDNCIAKVLVNPLFVVSSNGLISILSKRIKSRLPNVVSSDPIPRQTNKKSCQVPSCKLPRLLSFLRI